MRHARIAAAISLALSSLAQAQTPPADSSAQIPLSYVGTNASAAISVNDDGDFGGEARVFFGVDPDSLWFGEAWGQDYGAAGVKLGYHFIFGPATIDSAAESAAPVTVGKFFIAADRNRFSDEKVSLGFGLEREHWFGSLAISSATTDERLVGSDLDVDQDLLTGTENGRPYEQTRTISTLVESFEHPYERGVGARFGRYFDQASLRLQGGLDYETGEFDSSQVTASIAAQKFLYGTGHSLGLDIEHLDKDGQFELDKTDTRGWLTWRYEFGGDSFRATERYENVEHKREVTREVPSDPVVIRNEIAMAADAFFGLDSAVLTAEGEAALATVLDAVHSDKRVSRVSVVGHTCDLGPAEYNLGLSERRAAAVANWFAAKGVDLAEFDQSGKGESDPKYPNTRDERAKNRRVDVSFLTVEERTETPPPTTRTETIVEWVKQPVKLPSAWVERALRNPAQHKRNVDVYRYEETTVTTTLGQRVYLNRSPAAANDSGTVVRGSTLDLLVLGNDSDPDGNTLVVTAVSTPAHGSASFTANSVSYVPAAGFVGNDSFTYTISDGAGGTATATVSVTVTDRAPTAVNDSAETESGVAVDIPVLANDSDPDGDALSITSVGTAAHGTVSIQGESLVYLPATDFTGTDSFSYTITDAYGSTASATVNVVVTRVNLAPTARDDAAETMNRSAVGIEVLANDSDPEGDALTVVSFTQPANGTVVEHSPGVLVYQANAGFCGEDVYTYTIRDTAGNLAMATVRINVID